MAHEMDGYDLTYVSRTSWKAERRNAGQFGKRGAIDLLLHCTACGRDFDGMSDAKRAVMRAVKGILTACVILLTATSVNAEPPTLALGIGRLSCANWLNNPTLETDAHGWILGYWTAMNMYSSSNRVVGQTTDSVGIVAEVKLACGQRPSERIVQIINDVHQRLEREGR